jgi:aryl-alcohol dehydrogenase-like predicted oxidoreductase
VHPPSCAKFNGEYSAFYRCSSSGRFTGHPSKTLNRGLSRKAILSEIDVGLRRPQTDYVDLYEIHGWDPERPIEETLEALHDVVKPGKARYIGTASMYSWQFAKALYLGRPQGMDAVCLYAEPLEPLLP